MGTGSFPVVKCGRGVLLTTHPLLVPRSWKSRAIPLGHTGPVTGSLYFLPLLYLHSLFKSQVQSSGTYCCALLRQTPVFTIENSGFKIHIFLTSSGHKKIATRLSFLYIYFTCCSVYKTICIHVSLFMLMESVLVVIKSAS